MGSENCQEDFEEVGWEGDCLICMEGGGGQLGRGPSKGEEAQPELRYQARYV